jgi:hypothetical protein
VSEITVKLKDPKKIAWDNQDSGVVISGPDPVTVEETHFIRAKINEGMLVEVQPEPDTGPKAPATPPAETNITKELKKLHVPELQKVAGVLGLDYEGLTKDPLIELLAAQENILEKVKEALAGE